jgi:hypothetical protein
MGNHRATAIGLMLVPTWLSATNVIKSPGQIIDIWSELPIRTQSLADTVFVEGGTNSITLQAGAVDNTTYEWDINGANPTSYRVAFAFTDAVNDLPGGARGLLVRSTRGTDSQYAWIVYRNFIPKPGKPTGPYRVCQGTVSNYSTQATNALTYEWTITPESAGNALGSSAEVSVTWSSDYTGRATITAKGFIEASYGPVSEPLEVLVEGNPEKPTIIGDDFVKVGSTAIYSSNYETALSYTWTITSGSNLATLEANNSRANLTYNKKGQVSLAVAYANACGASEQSVNLNIEIFDPDTLQLMNDRITSLSVDNEHLSARIDTLLQKNDSLIVKTGELETLNAELQGQVDDLNTANAALRAEYQEALSSNEAMQAQIAELNQLNKRLQDENAQLVSDTTDLRVQMESLSQNFNDLQQQLDEQITINQELSLQLEILDHLNNDLQLQVDRLTEENSELKDENATLSQVYILQWSVQDVTTQVFETEIGNFSVSLFPNPSKGDITITCTETMYDMKIFNLQGALIREKAINSNTATLTVSRNDMPPGIYLIKISTQKGVATHRMVFAP